MLRETTSDRDQASAHRPRLPPLPRLPPALAPKGSNVHVTVDAENEATAIEHITHKACAQTVISFTRERGYTPAELAEVGIWAEETR